MVIRKFIFVISLGGLFIGNGLAQTVDPNLARNLAATCANCHGTNGKSLDDNIPSLAGMEAAKLTQTMKDFQSGAKPATVMHQIAKGYNNAQIELISTYFSARK
jgi:sulfide dehydrogenase cytochrome subunit